MKSKSKPIIDRPCQVAPDLAPDGPREKDGDQRQLSSHKILLVDDRRENLEFLSRHFKSLGCEVILSYNGREALEKVRRNRPSLIILDMMMPEMNGFEVARFLKDDPDYRDIPILAATALSRPGDRARCLAAGCNDYIAKPFTSQELEEHVAGLLSGGDPAVTGSRASPRDRPGFGSD